MSHFQCSSHIAKPPNSFLPTPVNFDLTIFMNCGRTCNLNHINYSYGLYSTCHSLFPRYIPLLLLFFLLKL